MADQDSPNQQQAQPIQTAFPLPPPFYKSFTPSNLAALRQLQESKREGQEGSPSSSLPATNPHTQDLPDHLINLLPPQPPQSGPYRCFTDPYFVEDHLPSLTSSGVFQLYPPTASPLPPITSSILPTDSLPLTNPTTIHLLTLAQSLLLCYIELVALLAHNPAMYGQKIMDMRVILQNMQHLISEYRPHQARESLAALMESEVQRTRTETAAIRKEVAKTKAALERIAASNAADPNIEPSIKAHAPLNGSPVKEAEGEGVAEHRKRVLETKIWETLERELGHESI